MVKMTFTDRLGPSALSVCLTVGAAGCGGAPSETVQKSGQAITAGDIYNFGTLAHIGSCMDALAGGTADGTQIQEYACNGTGAQSYQLVAAASGAFNIVNTQANKCVDVQGSGTANGTKIQLYDCNGTTAQTFTTQDAGNGLIYFVNTNSNKCLDVQADNPANGTIVQLYQCNQTNAQTWSPTVISTTSGGGSSGGGSSSSGGSSSGGFSVQDGALLISSALSFSETTVHPGDTVKGTVTFTNQGTASVVVSTAVIAGRPPGGTHAGGPFDDFGPASPAQTLAPGSSFTVTATRTFTASDPAGNWDVYPTWEDGSNTWHDGPDSSLTVTPSTTSSNGGGQGNSPAGAPLAVPATGGSGAHLVTVGSTNRLELHGVVVWGIQDFITNSFANDQHTNRSAIAANIAAWGGNVIRLRVLADEYVHLTLMGSDANYLQWIKDWVAAAEANGLYVQICWWDSLDSENNKNDANWASQYVYAFPMMSDVHNALKRADGSDDPSVFYEPFNEPNNVSWGQWVTAMEATVAQFRRTEGYQGLLVLDTTTWSHDYSDTCMGQLEAYDATLTSSGQSNLAFARHDYTNDYGNNFSGGAWISNTGNNETAHVIYETEFGNYNGAGNQSNAWSAAITSYFNTDLFDRSNVAGADAFLFGNWSDANAMSSDPSGAAPTTWGNDVKNWLSAY